MSANNLTSERANRLAIFTALPMALGLIVCGLIATPLKRAMDDQSYGRWTVPSQDDLQQASGTLLPVARIPGGSARSSPTFIGRILQDSGELLEYSCYPHDNDQGCVYGSPFSAAPVPSGRVAIRYFYPPNFVEPSYVSDLTASPGGQQNTVPRMNGAVLMEVTADDGASQRAILTYDQSQRRLNAFFLWRYSFPFIFAGVAVIGVLALRLLLSTGALQVGGGRAGPNIVE